MSKSTSRSKTGNEKSDKKDNDDIIKKEVDAVKEKLEHLSEKVKKNQYEKKEFVPDVYNDLHPYTEISDFILKKNNDKENGYLLRNTAVDLCDPWIDLKYDKEIRTDKIVLVTPRENKKSTKQKSSNQIKEGSTHLPKYYVSNLEDPDLAKKELYFVDVPMLRKTLHDHFSINSTEKIDFEYTRTKQDFYRMGLDKLNEIHPLNRGNLKSTYYAYLQNNPGSKKALSECLKSLEESKK